MKQVLIGEEKKRGEKPRTRITNTIKAKIAFWLKQNRP